VLLLLRLPSRSGASPRRFLLATKGVLAVGAAALASYLVFRGGGYRSLLAVLGVLVVLLRLSTVVRGATIMQWVVAAGLCALLSVVGAVAASLAGKGPYIVYALAFAASAGVLLLPRTMETSSWRTPAALAAFGWLAFAAGGVALHWGGSAARTDTAIVVVALVILAIVRTRPGTAPWLARRARAGRRRRVGGRNAGPPSCWAVRTWRSLRDFRAGLPKAGSRLARRAGTSVHAHRGAGGGSAAFRRATLPARLTRSFPAAIDATRGRERFSCCPARAIRSASASFSGLSNAYRRPRVRIP
jgi:hypothetical protein